MKTTITTESALNAAVASGALKLHHGASRRGYLSRKGGSQVEPYDGKFGKGYALVSPRRDTTRFVNVTYYVNA